MITTKFHFIEDYRRHVQTLQHNYPLEQAMSLAVGGNFAAIGAVEKQFLLQQGLLPHHTLIDVGCGSGRLAKALIPYLTQGLFLGTDVVPDLLAYAQQGCPSSWQFKLVEDIRIPYLDACADYCTFFSVFTHLLHEESYCYLLEACRVVKKGGMIVFSFLEFPDNWDVFEATYRTIQEGRTNPHINMFISRDAIQCWAKHLGLSVVAIYGAKEICIDLPEPIVFDDGTVQQGVIAPGQSLCVMRVNA